MGEKKNSSGKQIDTHEQKNWHTRGFFLDNRWLFSYLLLCIRWNIPQLWFHFYLALDFPTRDNNSVICNSETISNRNSATPTFGFWTEHACILDMHTIHHPHHTDRTDYNISQSTHRKLISCYYFPSSGKQWWNQLQSPPIQSFSRTTFHYIDHWDWYGGECRASPRGIFPRETISRWFEPVIVPWTIIDIKTIF
jgi:hypothetical protein